MDAPPIQYCRTAAGVNIAYWTLGEGPPLLFLLPPTASHLALEWKLPTYRAFYERVAEDFTVVRYATRNAGESARDVPDLSIEELAERKSAVESKDLHPKKCKAMFAVEIVSRFHDGAAGEEAEKEFDRVHAAGKLPTDMEEHTLAGTQKLLEVLLSVGLSESKSAARRSFKEGAVRVDGERVKDLGAELKAPGEYVVQIGKKRFRKIILS